MEAVGTKNVIGAPASGRSNKERGQGLGLECPGSAQRGRQSKEKAAAEVFPNDGPRRPNGLYSAYTSKPSPPLTPLPALKLASLKRVCVGSAAAGAAIPRTSARALPHLCVRGERIAATRCVL